MTVSTEYADYVLEQLTPVISLRTGRFFGGIGIFSGSVQFAMIMGNSLYFVVNDVTRPKYEEAGMGPFSYVTAKGRIRVGKYFELPEEVLLDPNQLRIWARESIAAANSSKEKNSKIKSKPLPRRTTKRRQSKKTSMARLKRRRR